MTTLTEPGLHTDQSTTELTVTERANEHLRTLDRMIRLTGLADTKAAPLLAAQATVAAVSATQLHKLLALARDGSAPEVAVGVLAAAIYLVCTSISIVLTMRVFLPRDSAGQGSLLYFADIASMPLEHFVQRSQALSAEGLERDALKQTHIVAGIVAAKFRRVRFALLAMIGALAGWIVLMALANY
jgi:hypothetical protein